MKIWVENKRTDLMNYGYYGDTSLQIEEYCNEFGLYFSTDWRGDCYVSKDPKCECFKLYEEV